MVPALTELYSLQWKVTDCPRNPLSRTIAGSQKCYPENETASRASKWLRCQWRHWLEGAGRAFLRRWHRSCDLEGEPGSSAPGRREWPVQRPCCENKLKDSACSRAGQWGGPGQTRPCWSLDATVRTCLACWWVDGLVTPESCRFLLLTLTSALGWALPPPVHTLSPSAPMSRFWLSCLIDLFKVQKRPGIFNIAQYKRFTDRTAHCN